MRRSTIGAIDMVGLRYWTPRRLKALDDENRQLKKLLAESMLDVATLREALGKTSEA